MHQSIQHVFLASTLWIICAKAEETAAPRQIEVAKTEFRASPAAVADVSEFFVKRLVTRRMDVTQSAEFPELPPIQGRITVSSFLIEDPHLKIPEVVRPAPRARTPEEIAEWKARMARYVSPRFASLSAVVYDHKRTLITWSFMADVSAKVDGHKEYSGWSNVDFTYYSCISQFDAALPDGTPRHYQLMMVVYPYETARQIRLSEHFKRTYQPPVIPEMADVEVAGPQFIVTGDDAGSDEAKCFFQGLHDLYQTDGERMKEIYFKRIKEREERVKFLLANPPKPENETSYFWKREAPFAEPPKISNHTEP